MNKQEIEKLAGAIIYELTHKWEYLRGKNEDFIEAIIPRLTKELNGAGLTKEDAMIKMGKLFPEDVILVRTQKWGDDIGWSYMMHHISPEINGPRKFVYGDSWEECFEQLEEKDERQESEKAQEEGPEHSNPTGATRPVG